MTPTAGSRLDSRTTHGPAWPSTLPGPSMSWIRTTIRRSSTCPPTSVPPHLEPATSTVVRSPTTASAIRAAAPVKAAHCASLAVVRRRRSIL